MLIFKISVFFEIFIVFVFLDDILILTPPPIIIMNFLCIDIKFFVMYPFNATLKNHHIVWIVQNFDQNWVFVFLVKIEKGLKLSISLLLSSSPDHQYKIQLTKSIYHLSSNSIPSLIIIFFSGKNVVARGVDRGDCSLAAGYQGYFSSSTHRSDIIIKYRNYLNFVVENL